MPPEFESVAPRRFVFERDSFAFANELVWEYRFGPDGSRHTERRKPAPAYAHRCFVLVRAARQFLYHARFAADASPLDEAKYRARLRQVLRRAPWRPAMRGTEIVFPGYAGLRDLSRDWEPLLKTECGGAWRSYSLRSHWRMVLPISRPHQAATAERLQKRVRAGLAPLVHLVCFPRLTINHGMMLFAEREHGGELEFLAYDPNDPAAPTLLTFDSARRTFRLPPNRYWPGGELNVIEIYRSRWF